MVFGTAWSPVEDAVRRAFGLDLFATVVLDLDDVRALARAVLGPVELRLAALSRDQQLIYGRAGVTALDADDTVAYLRSRTWRRGARREWVLTTDDDAGRIAANRPTSLRPWPLRHLLACGDAPPGHRARPPRRHRRP